jgi:CRISPR-associated protein Cmr5
MNIERERATVALKIINELPEDVGKYTSYVKALPAAILQNGLGQAMATLLAASKGEPAMRNGRVNEPHRLLYNHIQAWLCRDNEAAPYRIENGPTDTGTQLMEQITNGSEAAYIRAQAEALAYLNWLKKFAVAFRPEQESTHESTAQ